MLIFDFFSGTGSSTQAFKDAGHTVISFELSPDFESTHTVDMMDITSEWLYNTYGTPDFIWASPPCTAFSVASIGHHWTGGKGAYIPKTEMAVKSQNLVTHVRNIIEDLNPTYGYLIENPRGVLRKLPAVQGLPRNTITYCSYGDKRMKPTDLWGEVLNWEPRIPCKNGDSCHVAAPRGSITGTQGIKGARDRSRIPYDLGLEILNSITNNRKKYNEYK
jgi:hypothetical protein